MRAKVIFWCRRFDSDPLDEPFGTTPMEIEAWEKARHRSPTPHNRVLVRALEEACHERATIVTLLDESIGFRHDLTPHGAGCFGMLAGACISLMFFASGGALPLLKWSHEHCGLTVSFLVTFLVAPFAPAILLGSLFEVLRRRRLRSSKPTSMWRVREATWQADLDFVLRQAQGFVEATIVVQADHGCWRKVAQRAIDAADGIVMDLSMAYPGEGLSFEEEYARSMAADRTLRITVNTHRLTSERCVFVPLEGDRRAAVAMMRDWVERL